MPLLEGWFDGVCEPRNPGGHAAWGALLKDGRKVLWEASGYVGAGPLMSNNVAEYSGVIALLEAIADRPGSMLIRGDSKLVIQQLRGTWKIHGGLYVPYCRRAKALFASQLQTRHGNILLQWIPRDENSECDRLSKGELLRRGIEFRIQPEGVQVS